MYDKRDDFDFDIVNFPFLDDDIPRTTSYGVFISQLIHFVGYLVNWLISMLAIKTKRPNYYNKGIGMINFGKQFSKFIVDTLNWFLNIIPD